MILLGLGANLDGRYGAPEKTIEAAKGALCQAGVDILKSSRIWLTAPVPVSDQPWFRNAVLSVRTSLEPERLMQTLLSVEKDFGRVRGERNDPRILDIDILACNDQVSEGDALTVPHPRMHLRAFVLHPLREVAPGWVHPRLGKTVETLIEALPPGQEARPAELSAI